MSRKTDKLRVNIYICIFLALGSIISKFIEYPTKFKKKRFEYKLYLSQIYITDILKSYFIKKLSIYL